MAKNQTQSQAASPADVKAFADLRDRVKQAVREIERLRKENAVLAARVKELETGGSDGGFFLADVETPEELKARIQGFIATINDLIGETVDAA